MSEADITLNITVKIDGGDGHIAEFLELLAKNNWTTRIETDDDNLDTIEVLEVKRVLPVTADELLQKSGRVEYTIDFDRVGRNRTPNALTLRLTEPQALHPQALAAKIHQHVNRFLLSSHFEISLDGPLTGGSIEFGRYGTFTIKTREV